MSPYAWSIGTCCLPSSIESLLTPLPTRRSAYRWSWDEEGFSSIILRQRMENDSWSRFRLNVSAGSQKRAIHEPEGRNESRFSLISKRNLNVTTVKYILSLLGQTLSLLGQANCVGLRTLCPKRPLGSFCLLLIGGI